MTNEKPAPRTAAGRALMEAYRTNGNQLADWLNMRNAILAIEAEAAAAAATHWDEGDQWREDFDGEAAAPAATSASAEAEGSPGLDVDAARKAVEYAFEAAKEWQPDPVHSSMNNPIWPFDKFTDAFAAEYARLTAAAEASGE